MNGWLLETDNRHSSGCHADCKVSGNGPRVPLENLARADTRLPGVSPRQNRGTRPSPVRRRSSCLIRPWTTWSSLKHHHGAFPLSTADTTHCAPAAACHQG